MLVAYFRCLHLPTGRSLRRSLRRRRLRLQAPFPCWWHTIPGRTARQRMVLELYILLLLGRSADCQRGGRAKATGPPVYLTRMARVSSSASTSTWAINGRSILFATTNNKFNRIHCFGTGASDHTSLLIARRVMLSYRSKCRARVNEAAAYNDISNTKKRRIVRSQRSILAPIYCSCDRTI